jgi:phenylacetate-CoA ligase
VAQIGNIGALSEGKIGVGGTLNPLVPRFYKTLLATQVAPRDRIRAYQLHLLEKLVRHARAHVPFYRDSGRLDTLLRRDGSIDWARWEQIPILTRAEALANYQALMAERVPREMLPLEDDCTSGSTGEPLPFRRTELARVASTALVARALHWHRATPVRRFAVFESERRRALHAQRRGAAAMPSNTSVSISTADDPREQAHQLRLLKPTHILALTNTLLALAETAERPFDDVQLVLQAGEALPAEARARIAASFKAPVVDIYSASELGPIALEGTDGKLNVAEESVFFDWPSAGLDAIFPATITPFYAYAMPLIRYAPGDYVRFADGTNRQTPGLRQLDAVIGRERGLFRRADGTRFAPALSGGTLFSILPTRQWRLTQETLATAVLEIVLEETCSPAQVSALQRCVEAAIAPISVRIAPVTVIADDRASGKAYECYRSLVP